MRTPAGRASERLREVCSAESFVLQAAMGQARDAGGIALVESTCNQVNQDGGYTGVTPAAFAGQVRALAAGLGLAPDDIVLGGDHLGPYPWRAEPAASAMAKARELVRACALAGYTKIHLDPSMPLGGDARPSTDAADQASSFALDPEVVARRTAELCRAAEDAWAVLSPGSPAPLYVVGTEVPAPGGEVAGDEGPAVTRAADVRAFLDLVRAALKATGLEAAWERVVAVVVQPGVEFGDTAVFAYRPERARELAALPHDVPWLVYEAHSTDYQTEGALRALVRDHFAFLKVGPALTFAFREALFALEQIEREVFASGAAGQGGGAASGEPSRLRETLDAAMRADPTHWRDYYRGDEDTLAHARAFSLSDRCRYYWPRPEVRGARDRLLRNLAARPIPPDLLCRHLPAQHEAVLAGDLEARPEALIRHRIGAVLEQYWAACGAT
jgi:D-tagatose-1,6-bisphosphate aldolase subunit GatZ/KbaZ